MIAKQPLFTPTLGAIHNDAETTFRIWAPAQEEVRVVFDDDGTEVPMERDRAGFFVARVPGVGPGRRYWYRVRDGRRPDPASRYQPEGPLGPSEVVSSQSFVWTDNGWTGAPPAHRNVVYEMHIGTFTPEGTWRAAERHFGALVELGVTTLEVMPIAEFPGSFGWGYDGVDFFAPSRLYGAPEDVRHFVNAAHRHGLAVILDVVYNHFGPVGNFLRDFAPPFYGKPGEWGDTISYDASDSGPVRAFVIENAAYWISEFHFDGLRFDATHGIFDSSAEHVVSQMCAAARAAAGGRRLFLVGESESQDTRLLRASGVYRDGLDAIWNEDWHHAALVALTGRREGYFTDYRGTAGEFASMARHGFLYQGQWYSWQKQPRGGGSFGLNGGSIVCFLENHDQVANTGLGWRLFTHVDAGLWRAFTTLLLAGPHIPMLFQGQEFASSRPFTYFADHEGDLADAVERGRMEFLSQFPTLTTDDMRARIRRPADASGFAECRLQHDERIPHAWAVRLHRDLLRLRAKDDVLSRLGSEDVRVESSSPTETLLLMRYESTVGQRLLVMNLGSDYLSPMNDPLIAPPRGMVWDELWSSEHGDYGGTGVRPLVADGAWLVCSRSTTILAAVSPS